MNIEIHPGSCVGAIVLSNETCHSRYGIPALLVGGEAYGPADAIAGTLTRGADVVHGWAIQPGRTPEETDAAGAYLVQWPDGPQIGA